MNRTALLAGLAMAATAATGQVFMTFGYTDLDGIFTKTGANTGTFNAGAVDYQAFASSGDVTRIDGFRSVAGTSAEFDPGFVTLPDTADFQISLGVTVTGATTATSAGSFSITDINGDTIVGTIAGDWSTPGFGVFFFNGLLSGVTFDDAGTVDGFENGKGDSVAIDDLEGEEFLGAIQVIFINPLASFFNNDFAGQATLTQAQIVPTPAAVALLGMGGLVATGRRRR